MTSGIELACPGVPGGVQRNHGRGGERAGPAFLTCQGTKGRYGASEYGQAWSRAP